MATLINKKGETMELIIIPIIALLIMVGLVMIYRVDHKQKAADNEDAKRLAMLKQKIMFLDRDYRLGKIDSLQYEEEQKIISKEIGKMEYEYLFYKRGEE